MCVQDLLSLSTNITAEVTKQEVDHFVHMCKLFSKHVPKFDDEYAPSPTSTMNKRTEQSSSVNHKSKLNDLMKKESPKTDLRQQAEMEITSILAKYVRAFKPSLKLYPFGSTQYGIRYAGANFNLLIVDGKFELSLLE